MEVVSVDFVEIRRAEEVPSKALIDVYVLELLDFTKCRSLLQKLSHEMPLTNLGHLKRVKKSVQTQKPLEDGKNERKKSKNECLLLLLGPVRELQTENRNQEALERDYDLPVRKTQVPVYPPQSQDDWKESNEIWPVLYRPQQMQEHKEAKLALSSDEIDQMKAGMRAALKEQAMVVDPITGKVVGSSRAEATLQGPTIRNNPLVTPLVLAIQNVSRRQREHPNGEDYLCTGLDLYTLQEPDVFEAMAAVHARIRRMVVGRVGKGGLTHQYVHALPGTNHRFRAFYCHPESELGKLCCDK